MRGAGFETTQAKIANEAEEPDVIDISKLKKIGEYMTVSRKVPLLALQIPQKPKRFRVSEDAMGRKKFLRRAPFRSRPTKNFRIKNHELIGAQAFLKLVIIAERTGRGRSSCARKQHPSRCPGAGTRSGAA